MIYMVVVSCEELGVYAVESLADLILEAAGSELTP
jgi:hypothetical protein